MNWENIEFKNEKRFLSNMYPCEIKFSFTEKEKEMFPNIIPDNERYGSTEHIYQAMKSKNKKWHEIVRKIYEPRKTKTLVRKMVKKDILFETEEEFIFREDWDEIRVELMKAITYLKYTQYPELANKLKEIKGHIEERNDWKDVFWGTYNGEGENYLGRILMGMRTYLLKDNRGCK